MTIKISKNNTEELATTLLTCIDLLSRVLDNVVEVEPTPPVVVTGQFVFSEQFDWSK